VISGTLILGDDCYGPVDAAGNWGAEAKLNLRDATVHSFEDGIVCSTNRCDNTWPAQLSLNGFTYEQLGISNADNSKDMAARPASWWIEWLSREVAYSPQPYEYLATTLAKLGYNDKAVDILYSSKNRQLQSASFPDNILLWLERAVIGYGYHPIYAVRWALGFILLGAVVLRLSNQGPENKMPYGIAFSFDMLLPIVKLREYHYKIDLKGWARYYFYFHKLMGWALGLFLIAAVTGLTK